MTVKYFNPRMKLCVQDVVKEAKTWAKIRKHYNMNQAVSSQVRVYINNILLHHLLNLQKEKEVVSLKRQPKCVTCNDNYER